MKNKHWYFVIPLILVFSFLIIVPYFQLFWFEERKEENKNVKVTNFSFEELKKINKLFEEIDENKIIDEETKKSFSETKNIFKNEEKLSLEFEKIISESIEKITNSWKIETTWTWITKDIFSNISEKMKNEEKPKKEIFPKEFDITKKMSKLHIQERNQSCEAAATADILSTILKKDIKETEILDKMLKDKTYWKPSYLKDWKIIWWDPNAWFVGNMDAYQYNLTWYAIYEKPMSKIYDNYSVKYETYNKFENKLGLKSTKEALTHLLKEIYKWNFVQIWWEYCTDQRFDDWKTKEKISTQEANSWLSKKNFCYSFDEDRKITWFTEEWKEIKAVKQSHNFVLLWYIWDIENPEKIIVWDTQTWKHIYPISEWMRKWETNDARAIIIYNEKK